MAIMKIRGGDLDLVEYEFATFAPGKNLKTLGLEKKKYKVKPAGGKVLVKAPARIHLTVLDMNRFAPDHPGGGGIGFAIQCYCTAEVRCTEKEISIDYNRAPIVRNFVEVFRKVTGYKGGFEIRVTDHDHQHVGAAYGERAATGPRTGRRATVPARAGDGCAGSQCSAHVG